MCYKTNYEPYRSQSLDIRQEERSSEELLYPLGDLYPHVVALQLQSEEIPWSKAKNFSGYQDISYWAEASSRPPSETSSKYTSCRYNSDSTASRFVSRIRRLLSRDELRRRQRAA
ncbi:hypothetical protein ETB97_005263 [Aspergillus alliaceus]|uniref:Uncharacterized protein n=1 Tax=Petromyces alliaceus TaxID=209559 RepID=A0A5N6G995_PETAA|nr:uncharacterized protein BDW43DRAFT_308072 [Aspergillus alliaceus]KAB8237063.1 hypothetical protein BDW43DRAFT_308072 [Aspergillus alliaceus]KAE8390958.1 hypothetical protein BDV23DRAFT_183074 [Aspergillus alliaceus]KAF5857771.1 hypothetical protein ETB97_005263 [Aspergillus burnettii]